MGTRPPRVNRPRSPGQTHPHGAASPAPPAPPFPNLLRDLSQHEPTHGGLDSASRRCSLREAHGLVSTTGDNGVFEPTNRCLLSEPQRAEMQQRELEAGVNGARFNNLPRLLRLSAFAAATTLADSQCADALAGEQAPIDGEGVAEAEDADGGTGLDQQPSLESCTTWQASGAWPDMMPQWTT